MIRKAVFWAFSGQIATFVLAFAGSVIVARLLSPHELGVYAVATAVLGILQVVTSFGTAAYIVKEANLHEKALDTAFTVNALLSIALAATLYACSVPAAHFMKEDAVAPVLQLLALTPLISMLEFRPAAMLQREMHFKAISLVSTARAGAGALATVVAAVLGASYMSPAYGGLVSTTVGLIGFLLYGREHFSIRISRHGWRPMAIFGLQMMSVSGVSSLSGKLSDVVMGRLLGLEVLGLFSRANNLSGLLFSNVYGTATRIIFAKLSQDYRERGVVRDTFLPSLRIVGAIMGPICIGTAVISMPLVNALYGAKWIAAAPVLSILMVGQFVALSFAMNWELFVIRGQLGLQTKFEISRSIFGLVAQAIGCLFSVIGAALACIVGALFSFWLYAPHMRRLSDAKDGELGGIYAEATMLSCIASAPSFVLMMWFEWSATVPLVYVVPSVVAGAALWAATLFRIGHPLGIEMAIWTRKGLTRFSH